MVNKIAEKIAKHQAKPRLPGFSRKEKLRYKEELKALAAEHVPTVVETLAKLVKDKNVPASAKVAAGSAILDRFAGKPKLVGEKNTAESELDLMSEAQLLSSICTNLADLSQEARGAIAEALLCAQRGIAFDPRTIDPDYSESAASRAEEESAGLPPPERKPKKEPRR